jgi:hypothetical protein
VGEGVVIGQDVAHRKLQFGAWPSRVAQSSADPPEPTSER